jgi:multiple sugar transport system ATP-binding protein
MAFGLKLRRYPKSEIDSRVNTAAGLLGLEGLLDRKPKALSGGQRQRVALARAIVRQPQAFLFDEPLSNLDAKLRVQTRAELKQLHHRLETTTIYVTHDQEEAMTLGDRVVVMREGEVHQCASPLNVYQFPRNLFVAGFIGTPPMNLIEGRIEFKGTAAYFVEGQGGDSAQRLALPHEYWSLVEDYKDKEVVFGVRPENMTLDNRSGEKENAWAVSVTIVEPLGERMDVYVSTAAGTTMVARMDAQGGLAPEESVNLYMDMKRVHLFEPGPTGANLTHREPAGAAAE